MKKRHFQGVVFVFVLLLSFIRKKKNINRFPTSQHHRNEILLSEIFDYFVGSNCRQKKRNNHEIRDMLYLLKLFLIYFVLRCIKLFRLVFRRQDVG